MTAALWRCSNALRVDGKDDREDPEAKAVAALLRAGHLMLDYAEGVCIPGIDPECCSSA